MKLEARNAWLNTVDWYRRQPWPLKFALVLAPLFIGKVVDEALNLAGRHTGLTAGSIAMIGIGALAAVALLSRGRHDTDGIDGFPPIDLEDDIEVHGSFSRVQLEQLRGNLHAEIYGGSAPLGEEITRMYERNPVMGVGLFHCARQDYVGFATAWPLTKDAAKRIISGVMTENDLTADDVLPSSENARAEYVLVPAFGATRRHGDADRRLLGFKLTNELRRTIRRNFFARQNRRITLIATGFSEDGRKWCRRNGMAERCRVRFSGDPASYPVFTRVLTWSDVD